jgi:hypothetical protein
MLNKQSLAARLLDERTLNNHAPAERLSHAIKKPRSPAGLLSVSLFR